MKASLAGRSLFVRADSDSEIGAGHVMRCLALAQAWIGAGGKASMLGRADDAMRARIEKSGVVFLRHPGGDDLAYTLGEAGSRKPDWVVLDGYAFGREYESAIRRAGHRLMVSDDCEEGHQHDADVLFCQNLNADKLHVELPRGSAALLGSRFVLLRPEFVAARASREYGSKASKVLVTLGGADPDNVTQKVLGGLSRLGAVEVKVLVGSANRNLDALRKPAGGVDLIVDAKDMPALMNWADLAVVGGGTTCWEAASQGLPIAVLVLADNQRRVAHEIEREGAGLCLGEGNAASPDSIAAAVKALLSDVDARARMGRRGQQLIDGRGVDRVLSALAGGKVEA